MTSLVTHPLLIERGVKVILVSPPCLCAPKQQKQYSGGEPIDVRTAEMTAEYSKEALRVAQEHGIPVCNSEKLLLEFVQDQKKSISSCFEDSELIPLGLLRVEPNAL